MVAADLYFSAAPAPEAAGPELPGLARLARFGCRQRLPRGWRAWVAEQTGRAELTRTPEAAVASAALHTPAGAQSWLATPVHLTVSLTGVHLEPRGLLRLEAAGQAQLAGSFGAHFDPLGHALLPASGGGFVVCGPHIEGVTRTTDPARCLGTSVGDAQPLGPGSAKLKRLSAEIEMWLYAHPLNAARARAGEPPVSALWLWGGESSGQSPSRPNAPQRLPPTLQFFGDDAYLAGLAKLTGSAYRPVPSTLAGVAYPQGMTVIVVEVFRARAQPLPTPQAALESFDQDFLTPALAALTRGAADSFTLLANDRALTLRLRDRLRLWRRPRAALEALQ